MKRFNKNVLITSVAATLTFGMVATVQAETLNVVTSFSILKDMVEQVAGDAAEVSTLVGPNGDTHVFSPSPADARALKDADLLIVNGLEFEGWMSRLIEASGYSGEVIVATDGMDVLTFEEGGEHHDEHDDDHEDEHGHDDDHHDDDHMDEHGHDDDHHDDEHKDEHGHDDHASHDHHDHGEFDPHGWQSLTRAAVYVDNIAKALSAAKPESAAAFNMRAEAYTAELMALNAKISGQFEGIGEHCRTIVTSHDAFQYFGADYGLKFVAPQGLSTASEASARDVAALVEQVRDGEVGGIFVENISDDRLIEQIASETGLSVGGTLYSGALSEAEGPAATYLEMIAYNADQIVMALETAEASGACDHD